MSVNDEKKFTQAEVNAMMATNKKALQREREELERRVVELTALGEASRSRVGELEALLENERTARGAAEQQLSNTTASHRAAMNRATILKALGDANMQQSCAKWAEAEFNEQAAFEFDAEGKIASATYNGVAYAKLDEAAQEFIKAHPMFRNPPMGGSGHPHRAGTIAIASRKPDITEQDPKELLNDGWRDGAA